MAETGAKFSKSFIPNQERKKFQGGKDAKTAWMQKLERIRNQNFHSTVSKKMNMIFYASFTNG